MTGAHDVRIGGASEEEINAFCKEARAGVGAWAMGAGLALAQYPDRPVAMIVPSRRGVWPTPSRARSPKRWERRSSSRW